MVASLFALTVASFFALGQAAAPFPLAKDQVKTGDQCTIGWNAATSDLANWQGFSIELMTGSDTNMIPLKTLTTGQDGTKDGSFSYTCPAVTINAPIYFYRFNPGKSGVDPNYSSRFAIASIDGRISPAPQQTQPDGSPVPWGIGALSSGTSTTTTTGSSVPPTTTTRSSVTPTTTTNPPGGGGGGGGGGGNGGGNGGGKGGTTTINGGGTVTVTKTVSPPAQKTTVWSVSTTTKIVTSYVPNYITVTQNQAPVTATTTVTVGSSTPSVNAKGAKSSASRSDIPLIHLLTFTLGSVIACITLFG